MLSEPLEPLLGFGDGIAIFLERDVLRGTRETEVGQPPAVRERPALAPRIAAPLPEQERLEAVFDLRADADGVFARAHQIPHRLVGCIGNIDRTQFAGPMQPRQHLTVPPIRLDAIPAALGNHRGTHDHAVFAALGQVSIDPESARPGLVDEVQLPVRRAEGAHHLVERLEIARDHAVVADFAVAGAFSDGDVDRFFVDIEPYEHATFPHDLPPRVWAV